MENKTIYMLCGLFILFALTVFNVLYVPPSDIDLDCLINEFETNSIEDFTGGKLHENFTIAHLRQLYEWKKPQSTWMVKQGMKIMLGRCQK